MIVNWLRWVRSWSAWGRRRVLGGRFGLPARRAFLSVLHLEDRTVPTFPGGVTVASGDFDADGYRDLATGAWAGGGPHVRVVSGRTGDELFALFAYDAGFRGGVNVAVGDVTGDGRVDLITGAGAGGGPHVKVFDGGTGREVRSFFAYDPGFLGGVSVAAGDFDGDGVAEVVTGAGPGGGPHLKVFDGRAGEVVRSFFAYDAGFRGGVNVAVGDVTGDGRVDLITGAGAGGGPHVKVFDGGTGREVRNFFAYDAGFPGGVHVSTGDVTGDGVAEVVAGAGNEGGPHVRVFTKDGATVQDFMAFDPHTRGGVWVTAGDVNGDGRAEVLTGAGVGLPADHRGFDGATGWAVNGLTVYGRRGDEVGGYWGLRKPPEPLLQGGQVVIPGSGGAPVRMSVRAAMRETTYRNEVGLYAVDDAAGRVGNLLPTDPGYVAAALAAGRRVTLDPAGRVSFDAQAGSRYGLYMVQDGSHDEWAARNPSNAGGGRPLAFLSLGPTPDGFPHGRAIPGWNRFGWEDLTGGGDQDFNDFVAEIRVGEFDDSQPPSPPALPPVVPFPTDLSGWTVAERGGAAGKRGAVSAADGKATLTEGDSFVTTLSKSFVVTHDPADIQFTYAAPPRFDESATGFVRDSFEAALLDPAGNPLVGPYAAGRDSFFNATEGATGVVSAPGVTVSDGVVTLDLSGVPVGTVATLVFRLVNNDSDTGSTVTLATTALPTAGTAEAPVKFFVADAGRGHTYRYGEEGLGAGQFGLTDGMTPSGAASNPAGDRVWVVDAATKRVSVTGPSGTPLGSWAATDAVNPQGVTVDDGTLWLVDRGSNTVRRYVGGAVRSSGEATATDSFALDAANAAPSDLVTDGSTVWVTDDATAEVFVYTTAGAVLGRWKLDGDNPAPSGITRNPAGGTDLWVLDRVRRQVFQYPTGTNARTGAFGAAGTFHLAPGNASPEGIADPPVLTAFAPAGPRVESGRTVLVQGVAAAGADGAAVEAVTLNGAPVTAVDGGGRYFAAVRVRAGENRFDVAARDANGGVSAATVVVAGGDPADGRDAADWVDVTTDFRPEYARTSFREGGRTLFADVAVRNVSEHPAGGPLYTAVTNISDPAVRALNPAGTLLDGTPYFDFTDRGASPLVPAATSGTLSLAFSNPNRGRFTYDLVFFGVPNRPPAFATVPETEGTVGREYAYAAAGTDPDGDPLEFALVSGPAGMAVTPAGRVTWTPTAGQTGTAAVVLRLTDGRGGAAEQAFTVTTELTRPNRPPVFTSTPVAEAHIGHPYRYDADAADPDRDTLTYSLVPGVTRAVRVANPSFEDWLADSRPSVFGLFSLASPATVPGWDLGPRSEIMNDNYGGFPLFRPSMPDGRFGITSVNDVVSQRLDEVLAPDTVYDLTVDVGVRDEAPPDFRFRVQLWAGDHLLGETVGQPGPTGTFAPVTVSYRSTHASPALGVPLQIRLVTPDFNTGIYLTFDNVRVTATSPPAAMTIDPHSGLIAWQPGPDQAGDWVVDVRVDDGRGGTAVQRVNLCVAAGPANRPPVIVSRPTTQVLVQPGPSVPAPWDLRTWGMTGYDITPSPAAAWQVSADGIAVTQTADGDTDPSLYLSPDSAGTDIVEGEFRITDSGIFGNQSVGGTVGIVFGYQNAETFYLLEWRGYPNRDRQPTVSPYGVLHQGLRLRKVAADTPLTSDDFWREAATDARVETVYGDSIPWVTDKRYQYRLVSRPGRFTLEIIENGVVYKSFSHSDPDFAPGRVGYFTHGQGRVTFSNATRRAARTSNYSYQVAALDGDNDPVTYTLVSGPEGMHLHPATGLLTWTPTDRDRGSHPVVVRADDGKGGSDTQTYRLAVDLCGPLAREFNPYVSTRIASFPGTPPAVMATPAVVDWNADGYPDIVVPTYFQNISLFTLGGFILLGTSHIHVISGRDQAELITPFEGVDPSVAAAVGDLDGDGRPDAVIGMVTPNNPPYLGRGYPRAVRNDGSVLWDNPGVPMAVSSGSIADVTGDGRPEVLIGSYLLNGQTGEVIWHGSAGTGANPAGGGFGPLSVAADLDLTGTPEVLAGNTAYRSDGSVYWTADAPDGFTAVANFDADPYPEVVLVSSGQLYLLEHDGRRIWGPVAVPQNEVRGGAPTVSDLDGDGVPEILVATDAWLNVFDAAGTLRWQRPATDAASGAGVATAFDFDGDGVQEVVYSDERGLYILDGLDGHTRYELGRTSPTAIEYAIVVDYDRDGSADIVVGSSSSLEGNFPKADGLFVISDYNGTWQNTRSVWNEYSYHVTNVTDDGSIPAGEQPSWLASNTYRVNPAIPDSFASPQPDLLVSAVTRGGSLVTATVTNAGAIAVEPGVLVAFYDGDPAKGGRLLGSAPTRTRLAPSGLEAIPFPLSGLVNDLWVRVDDDGRGLGAVPECDESNNAFRAGVDTDPVNYAPVFNSTPPAAAPANGRYIYRPVVLDPDGDPVAFDVIAGPAGLRVHPTLGVVAWTPFRDQIGTHQVVLRVTDAHGNVNLQPFTITVTVPNSAPVITSAPPAGPAVVGAPFEYAVAAQDAEDAALAYALEGAPAGAAVSAGGVVTWTPAAGQVGPVTFTVVVTDPHGAEARQTVTLTVVASGSNRTPTAVVEAAESAWLGRTYVARVVGADADGDPVRYTLTAGPVGMAVDAATGVVTWQPTVLAATPISAAILVTDGRGGEATVSFAVRVTTSDENRAPAVISVPGVSATVGSTFAYDLVGRDPDGDPVLWDLVSGPQGMSVNAATGTLRWAPAHDQLGPVSVTVRARDPLTAEGTQTFTVTVACANQPPVVASAPPTAANAGFVYLYAVRATDPENDPLTFTLDQAPAGMAFVPGTSLIRWVPTAEQAGPQSVVVRVTDRAGNSATQTFSVVVTLETPNLAPAVASRPVTGAVVGRPYSYQVVARDPDGDALTYTLAAKPDGMTISPTGLVTWTPTSAATPTVTVEVTDGRGGVGVQTFVLTARTNTPPRLAALPDGTATSGGVFRALARATDPEGDPLAFRLDQAPAGMTIDGQGRIRWTADGPPRGEVVRVTAVDPDGLSDSKSFTVSVVADVVAPTVAVTLSHPVVRFGSPVTVTVRATDAVGVSGLTLTAVRGTTAQPLALDAQGRATFTPTTPGRYTFVAVATDPAGNAGEGRAELVATDPAATGSPVVSFTRLSQLLPGGRTRDFDPAAEVASVTYLTDVFGTVRDPDGLLDSWQAYVGRSDLVDPNNLDPSQPFWRPVASGTAEIRDGRLFTFDPTLLPNDRYTVIVVAHNLNGRGTVTGVDVDVTGNAKLGEFRLEFTDLNLPLNGIPVQVTRVYDTRDAAGSKDFGYGWTLAVADARIRETVAPGPGDGLFSEAKAFKDGTKVYLNLPDGGRAGFTFKPVVSGGVLFFGAAYVPKFVADPGVRWKLEVDTTALRPNARGEFQTIVFPIDYNPDVYRLVSPDGLTYTYSQSAGLQRIDDRSGNSVTYTADGITHSGGRHVQFVRDGQGRVTTVVDPDGNAIRYAYTAAGDLASVTDQMNQTTRFAYRTDRPHYLDEVRDPLGRRAVKTEYDAAGRVVAVTDANGNRTEQAFDPLNFAETVKDARGNPTLITYNDRGNVVRTELATEFGPIVTQTVYGDPANPDKETTVVNPRGFATSKTYDDRGNVLTETTPDGTTAYTFSAADKLLTVTDTLGRVTAYDYSPQGNLVRVVNALGDSSLFTYDGLGRVSTFTDFAGNTTTFLDYCECGRPMTIENPDGTVRRIETNGFSQVTKSIDESGNTTENEYDAVGRLVRVVDGEGSVTDYEYEVGASNVALVRDPLGSETRYAYDAAGRKTRITDAEGGVTKFSYDLNGNLEAVTDPVNNVTRFVYDAANRVKEEIDPLGVSKIFAYDAAGNKTEVTDRNGRTRTFTYDPMSRVTAETWLAADGSVVRVIVSGYDKVGNLLETSDPDAVLTYTYDALNRVKTAATFYSNSPMPAVTLTYRYDANGNHIGVVDNFGVQVDSVYDDRNQLESRTWQSGGIAGAKVVFDYFDNGERRSLDRYADATGTKKIGSSGFDYWRNGLAKTITHANSASQVLVNYDYQYDPAGRLTQESHHGNTYSFGYDKTSQLLTVNKDGSLFESFSYDTNGNRRTSTGPNGNQTYAPAGPGNQQLNDGLFTYSYDREGNLKTKTELSTGAVTEHTWDHRKRLVKVEQRSAGGVVLSLSEYTYDARGRRISQATNGQRLWTVYDRDHAWVDTNTSGAVEARYLFGDRIDAILARWKPGVGTGWHLTDKLGTIRDVVGATGAVINHLDYTAFGQIMAQTNSAAGDRFAFTGREWDTAVGDYYYRARYYNPTAGQFTSVDPIGFVASDANLYRYGFGAPLQYSDPFGTSALTVYALRVQASIGGGEQGPNLRTASILGGVNGLYVGFSLGILLFMGQYLVDTDFDGAVARLAGSEDKAGSALNLLGSVLNRTSDAGGLDGSGYTSAFFDGFGFDTGLFFPDFGAIDNFTKLLTGNGLLKNDPFECKIGGIKGGLQAAWGFLSQVPRFPGTCG